MHCRCELAAAGLLTALLLRLWALQRVPAAAALGHVSTGSGIAAAAQMLATLAADPLASLVDTAFVGHLGAAQLAGAAA